MVRMRNAYKIRAVNPKGKNKLGDLSINWEKVKVKLSLYLTKHHAMKAYWRSGLTAQSIFDLGIRWR
jgi:hypothetical protein